MGLRSPRGRIITGALLPPRVFGPGVSLFAAGNRPVTTATVSYTSLVPESVYETPSLFRDIEAR